ncbi:DUF6170 family protein [Paraglaciecola sp. MB-3u-78]|uniref:DUF6170 family protein n=1 Tax=Paraglaciecola sp. MB-3u-78 TaxID=2058332 RepID=UPI000C34C304|nr:DUF6170 family protein [Paraglaciecola sp. MB-3u-78]PKG98901.1 hypothetical protein CXF95_13790 [Paraglaciecola sp. MB-3u-78]
MKLYFSTKQIPQLQSLSLTQRLAAVQLAQGKLIGPEKLFLNVLKMLVVIPVFILIIQMATNWMAIIWALLVTLLYPMLVKPVQYGLCAKYIPQSNPHPEGDK